MDHWNARAGESTPLFAARSAKHRSALPDDWIEAQRATGLAKLHTYLRTRKHGHTQPCAKRTTCVTSGVRTEQVRRAVGESVVAHVRVHAGRKKKRTSSARLCRRLATEDERRLRFDHGRGADAERADAAGQGQRVLLRFDHGRGTDAERADAAGQGQRVLLYDRLRRRLLRQRRRLVLRGRPRLLQRLQEVVRPQEETCINKHEQEQYTPAG
jgi:hypothetical protein